LPRQFVFLVAGTVGGILANQSRPAEFIYDNLLIHATVVHAAHLYGTTKPLYLGSSCIYPRECAQPIKEEYLLTGALESTNEAYAVATIAGIKLCQHSAAMSFQRCRRIYTASTIMSPLRSSHVLPALIRKFHDAKQLGQRDVTIWGTGQARREFLHVDDLADACVFLMRHYDVAIHINVGTGDDLTIRELAETVRSIVISLVCHAAYNGCNSLEEWSRKQNAARNSTATFDRISCDAPMS